MSMDNSFWWQKDMRVCLLKTTVYNTPIKGCYWSRSCDRPRDIKLCCHCDGGTVFVVWDTQSPNQGAPTGEVYGQRLGSEDRRLSKRHLVPKDTRGGTQGIKWSYRGLWDPLCKWSNNSSYVEPLSVSLLHVFRFIPPHPTPPYLEGTEETRVVGRRCYHKWLGLQVV